MSTVDEAYIQKLLRTVNHDMSATLRSSVGFSTLILSEFDASLDDKVKKWLRLNVEQGEKTQASLIALSSYARLYNVKEELARCDLAVLANEVCNKLQTAASAAGMTIEVNLSSPISGYKLLWSDYLQQVIANAFMHSQGSHCKVYEERDEAEFKLIIEDDGEGLDTSQMAEAILPFRKLTDSSAVGMGLARAKRIVEIHGGQLQLCTRQSGLCVEAVLPADIAAGATLLNH